MSMMTLNAFWHADVEVNCMKCITILLRKQYELSGFFIT